MNVHYFNLNRLCLLVIIAFLVGALAGCEYRVPITRRPTRNIDTRLIGNWVSNENLSLKIRSLNETTYIVSYSGVLFEAYHSDVSGVPFLTVQELETSHRSYTYLTYSVSADGNKLYLRLVNDQVIPRETESTAMVQELLNQNLQNPGLLLHQDEFTKLPE